MHKKILAVVFLMSGIACSVRAEPPDLYVCLEYGDGVRREIFAYWQVPHSLAALKATLVPHDPAVTLYWKRRNEAGLQVEEKLTDGNLGTCLWSGTRFDEAPTLVARTAVQIEEGGACD